MKTYLEKLEESLTFFSYVSTAGDNSMACASAELVLKEKAPESMTPKERQLAIELCYKVGDYSLLKMLHQLDNIDTTID